MEGVLQRVPLWAGRCQWGWSILGFEEVATRTCVGRERKEVCWGVLASDGVCVDLLTEGAPYVSEILELLREVPFGLLHIDFALFIL